MNAGDFGFHWFRFVEVREVTRGRITSVSTGVVQIGGTDMKVFPLSLEAHLLSDFFHGVHTNLHALNSGLNYPDIARYLESQWEEAMQARSPVTARRITDNVKTFEASIMEKVKEKRGCVINGVKVFK